MGRNANDALKALEHKREVLERNLDKVFAEYIRKRDKRCCVITGSMRRLTISHIFSQTDYPNTRWDEQNAVLMSVEAHRQYHESNPLVLLDWYVKTHGEEQLRAVQKRAESSRHHYGIQELIELTNQYVRKTQSLPAVKAANGQYA